MVKQISEAYAALDGTVYTLEEACLILNRFDIDIDSISDLQEPLIARKLERLIGVLTHVNAGVTESLRQLDQLKANVKALDTAKSVEVACTCNTHV